VVEVVPSNSSRLSSVYRTHSWRSRSRRGLGVDAPKQPRAGPDGLEDPHVAPAADAALKTIRRSEQATVVVPEDPCGRQRGGGQPGVRCVRAAEAFALDRRMEVAHKEDVQGRVSAHKTSGGGVEEVMTEPEEVGARTW
jgi:hypothetical protein